MNLASPLDAAVIAEGVETAEQLDALLDLGCPYGQGFLLSRPLAADECVEALRAQA